MLLTRRTLLRIVGALPAGHMLSTIVSDREMLARIARVIREYDAQGDHRTGSEIDDRSGRWLAALVEQIGLRASLESFRLSRVDPGSCYLEAGDRRVDGLPMFDGTFTDQGGVTGRLGKAGSESEFALVIADPMVISNEAEPIADLRKSNTHKGLVVVTRAARPGLSPINARHFTAPFGPPALQISSEEEPWLTDAAARQQEMTLVVQVTRIPTVAHNVVAQIRGSNPRLPPLIVWTPRSGWWNIAAERGGGLACWLEGIRAATASKPARNIIFLATSGHELGHLGLEAFLTRRPALAKEAFAWLLFGANIGAAGSKPITRLQASDAEIERMADEAMAHAGTKVNARLQRGDVPGGEVRNIHERGGRYLSLGGTNPYFHSAADRWPSTVDVLAVERYARAFAGLIVTLASSR